MFSRRIVAALFCLVAAPLARAEDNALPNIVIIYADDVGFGDVGCYGATHVETPNIDQLALQGRKFTDAHAASAVCTPSRYALVTGQYPARRDFWAPVFVRSPLIVDTERTTIADIAKRAGYSTTCIGKWHLGWGSKQPTDWNAPLVPGPQQLGFDTYFGVPVLNSHPPFVYVENDRPVGWTADDPFVYGQRASTRRFDEKFGLLQIGGAKRAHEQYDDEALGTVLTKRATDWIEQQAKTDSPFFLYLATTNIHHPFTPAKRFQGTSKAGPYGDFIHELDWMVGEVIAALDKAQVADNTLVIFSSDNGGMLNRGGQEAYRQGHRMNGELLGFKFDAWEGGHRVPMIVRWPGQVPSGSVSDSLVSSIDFAATVAAIGEQKLEEDEAPDSVNLLPALLGKPGTVVREELLVSPAKPGNLALRRGDWMFISGQAGGGFSSKNEGDHGFGGPAAMPFTGQVNSDIEGGEIRPDAPAQQLYNLKDDPRQAKNVIEQHPDVAEDLRQRMAQILGR